MINGAKENKELNKESWQFSAKHTRLRFQLIGSSSIALLSSLNSTTNINFTLLGFSFNGAKSGYVFLIALVFSMFALVSFVVRTTVERNKIGKFNYIIKESVDRLYTSLNEVKFTLAALKVDVESFYKNSKTVTSELSQLENILASYESRIAFIEKDWPEIRTEVAHLNDIPMHFALTAREHGEKEFLRQEMKIQELQNDPNKKDELYLHLERKLPAEYYVGMYRDRYNEHDNSIILAKINKLFDEDFESTRSKVLSLKEDIKFSSSSTNRKFKTTEASFSKLNLHSTKFKTDLKKKIIEERNNNRAVFLERELLGFWMPLISSIVFIGAAIWQYAL